MRKLSGKKKLRKRAKNKTFFEEKMASSHIGPILLTALLVLSVSVDAVGTRIPAGQTECYSESIEASSHITATFIVVDGGEKDIDAYVTVTTIESKDPRGTNSQSFLSSDVHQIRSKEMERWTRASEGSYSYVAPSATESGHGLPSKLTICFSNTMSRWTPKWIDFSLIVDKSLDPTKAEISAESELEHRLHEEGQRMFRIRNLMHKVVLQEETHRNKVESTNAWVMYGTIVNGGLLIVMSVFQFWYLKRFLSTRPNVGGMH